MKNLLAVQGSFDIGYAFDYDDSFLAAFPVVEGVSKYKVKAIDFRESYDSTFEKPDFGMNIHTGYGLEIDITDDRIDRVWDENELHVANLGTFETEFEYDAATKRDLLELIPKLEKRKTRIVVSPSGVCTIEKMVLVNSDIAPQLSFALMHCMEYGAYSVYAGMQSLPEFVQECVSSVLDGIFSKKKYRILRSTAERRAKSTRDGLRAITGREVRLDDSYFKSFSLCVFSGVGEVIEKHLKFRQEERSELVEYKKIFIELDACHISWYVQLFHLDDDEDFSKVETYLLYMQIFTNINTLLDVLKKAVTRKTFFLSKNHVTRQSRKMVLSKGEIRLLRAYTHNIYNASNYNYITENVEIVALYDIFEEQAKTLNLRSELIGSIESLNAIIQDNDKKRQDKLGTLISVLGLLFSAAGVVQAIESLKNLGIF